MKKPLLFRIYLFILLFIISFPVFSQSIEETNEKILSQMDLTPFKGKALLNKGIIIEDLFTSFQKKEVNKDGSFSNSLSSMDFIDITNSLERSSLDDQKRPEIFTKFENRSRDEVTNNNTIPIGIINSDAYLLTPEQVQENIKFKTEEKVVNPSNYEKIEIITAGLIQNEIFQSKIDFQVSPDWRIRSH